MIKFEKLNKYYNKGKKTELHVLKNVSYEFPSTGLVTFLGESGSGKTTLLNLLGGLLYSEDTIYHDNVKFNKNNVVELDNYRNKNIGFIFQNYLLLNDETVYDNLKLALEVSGIFDKDEQEKRIVETLKALKIYRYRKKLAGKLSGGEQQRVSIARAIVKGAKVLLCDEPTGNLDKKNSIKVMDILRAISKSTLVILVTHNKELAHFYSDKIVNMKDGTIVSDSNFDSYTLDTTYSDTIYLGELENKTIADKINVNYYTDDSKDVSLRVILKNGHLYVESNLPTEIVSNGNVDIREGVREVISNESFNDDFKFDDFKDIYGKDNSFWELFKKKFKTKKITRKNKVFNRLSFILGVILTFWSLLFVTFYNVTKLNSYYNEGFYTLKSDEDYLEDIIDEGLKNNYISNIAENNINTYTVMLPSFMEKNYKHFHIDNLLEYYGQDLLCGKAPDSDGIVISEKSANLLNQYYECSFDDILKGQIKISGVPFNINGITKNGTGVFYDRSIIKKLNAYNYYSLIDIEDKNSYKIVESIPMVDNQSIYVEKSSGLELNHYFKQFYVAGYIEEIPNLDNVIVTSNKFFSYFNRPSGFDYVTSDVNIVEGRNIRERNEILAPKNYANVGEKLDGFVIVGLYEDDNADNLLCYLADDIVVHNYINGHKDYRTYYYYASFKVDNLEAFTNMINNSNIKNLKFVSEKEAVLRSRFNTGQLSLMVTYLFILLISTIYIYFMKRSEIIVDHYNITVLRSMGATKKYIYKRYLISNIVDSIKTITFGSVLTFIVFYFVQGRMESILVESLNILILVGFLMFSYFLIALIPLNNILRKEPAYLTAKYDI